MGCCVSLLKCCVRADTENPLLDSRHGGVGDGQVGEARAVGVGGCVVMMWETRSFVCSFLYFVFARLIALLFSFSEPAQANERPMAKGYGARQPALMAAFLASDFVAHQFARVGQSWRAWGYSVGKGNVMHR